jgi:hypothetical protein
MPLPKKSVPTLDIPKPEENQQPASLVGTLSQSIPARIGGEHKAGDKAKAPLTKEGYWDRKEERDVQRDKDMAWSGLAQAALASVGVIQLNADNTEDGLVSLVVRITDKLLKARDSRNQ